MRYRVGQCLGNYRIIGELGRGGCGDVYLATHVSHPYRMVAIKILNAVHRDSRDEQDRFRREVEFLDQLKHPHILPVIDMGSDETCLYLVTEHASQGSLKDRLDREPNRLLPSEHALKILFQVGQALQYAHQRGVVHRDVKPANILLTTQGDALLADFGIARMLSALQTEYGEFAGTPVYMAPEQFQQLVSPKCDQYALGCIAYELFSGRQPFSAADLFSFAFKHLHEQPYPLTYYNPCIPQYIEHAILKAMAKERRDRHPDIAAFLEALHLPHDLTAKTSPLGHSLTLFLQEKGSVLDEEQVLIWMIRLCEVMNAYHTRKPARIFGEITPDHVLITLFGDIRLPQGMKTQCLDPEIQRATWRYRGEYSYIAPEALCRKYGITDRGLVDARSDVYSLGAIMYLLLTNDLPEPLQTPTPGSILMKNSRLTTIYTGTGVMCPSEEIIIRAMHQDPARRFQDAKTMWAALQQCLAICKQKRT